jgi:hypothetical protein
VDVDEVRRLARHRSVTTTLNNYAESTLAGPAAAVNATKPLPSSFANPLPPRADRAGLFWTGLHQSPVEVEMKKPQGILVASCG